MTSVTANYAAVTANYASVTANYAVNFANTVVVTSNYLSNTVNYAVVYSNLALNTANTALMTANLASNTANYVNTVVNIINQAVSLNQGYLPNLSVASTLVSNLTIQSNLIVTLNSVIQRDLIVAGNIYINQNVIGGTAFGCGVSLYTLGSDVIADHSDGPNGDFIIKWGTLTKSSIITVPANSSFQFIRSGVFNIEVSVQPIDSTGNADSVANVYLYTNTTDSLAGATLVYRDSPSTQVNPGKTLINVPVVVSNKSLYYILGISFTRTRFPYTLKQTYLPSGATGGSYFQMMYLGGTTDTLPPQQDTTLLTYLGTNAPGPVYIGNPGQPLLLQCSSLTVPFNLGITAGNTSSLGTTANQPITIGNVSQTLTLQGSSVILPASANANVLTSFGTQTTAPVTIGTPSQTLQLQGSSVNLPSTTNATQVLNYGTTAGGTVTIGTSSQQLVVQGNPVSLPATTDASTVTNYGTSASGPVTVGSASQSLVLQGTSIILPVTSNANIVTSFGTQTAAKVTVGTGSQQLQLQGNPVSLPATTDASLVTNFGGSATSGVTLGVSGQSLTVQGVANPMGIGGALSDEISIISTISTWSIRVPYGFNIRSTKMPYFSLNVLPTAATPVTFDILQNGGSIYSVKPTISSTSSSNSSYSSQGTLLVNPTQINFGDLLSAVVLNGGSGSPAGAKVYIYAT